MRKLTAVSLTVALVAIAGCAGYSEGPRARPRSHFPEIELSYFYGALAPFGVWVSIDTHGWVWRPTGVPIGWRPYTEGHWVWTTYGWTWVSDWRWGWAPFHYGRWWRHPSEGWLWIPGRTWAPAWVAWRESPGWIGWAPLPPEAHWRASIGFSHDGAHLAGVVGLDAWVFVEGGRFLDPRLNRVVVSRDRNERLVQDTRPSLNYSERGGAVVNHGLAVGRVENEVGRRVPVISPTEVKKPPRNAGSGDRVRVYRPRVSPAEPTEPPPSAGRTRTPKRKPPS